MRVFFDSNVLVSLALAPAGALRELADFWLIERRFTVVSSDHVLGELERALSRPYFSRRINTADRGAYVALVRREALVVTPRTKITGMATHPEDDAVLEAALDGGVRYLITGDRGLRDLRAFRGIEILSPRDFLEIVESELGTDRGL